MIILKEIDLRTATVKLRDDGIMQYNVKPVEEFGVNDLKEINEAVGKLGDGKKFPNLVCVNHFLNVDAEVRKYAATEESNRYTIADAFVINSTALKLIGNFYIRFDKPVRPTRIFNSDIEAIPWLKTFL